MAFLLPPLCRGVEGEKTKEREESGGIRRGGKGEKKKKNTRGGRERTSKILNKPGTPGDVTSGNNCRAPVVNNDVDIIGGIFERALCV